MVDCKRFKNKRICVAVSGGADSVALLYYLKEQGEYALSAIHCEHGIRGEESLADMRFVEELCRTWGIPLTVVRADCPALALENKESLETAARNFRYRTFFELLERGEADYIATAHHKGDEAETVLFRLARGSALAGVSGIKRESNKIIRPFLNRSKEEILRYVKEKGLKFCEDSTNTDREFTRNKLRLEVLPKLEEAVPGAAENLVRFAQKAAEDDALLYRLSASLIDGDRVEFCNEKPLFTRACLTVMKGLGMEKDYSALHLSALYELQTRERGAYLTLPNGLRAKKEESGVRFYLDGEEKLRPLNDEAPFDVRGYDGGRYEVKIDFVPDFEENTWKMLRCDLEKIPDGAVFRFRREGDYIYRFGGGKKSLKKFFNEEKVEVTAREGLPLIAVGSEVYAVCGVEISKKIAVDSKTEKTAYIVTKEKK